MPDHRLTTAILAALHAVGAACHVDGGSERRDCSDIAITYKVYPQESIAPADLVAVTANNNPRLVFAVDVDGKLVARDDDALYRPIAHPATGTLRDVQIVAPQCLDGECPSLAVITVIAVGDGGSVLRSEDLGATWSAISLATTADLRSVTFTGDIGIIAGDGVLFRSEDRGVTWSSVALPPEQAGSFNEVTARRDTIIAIGDAGLALKSLDTGLTWVQMPLGTSDDLEDVVACDDYHGTRSVYITTASGEVRWFYEDHAEEQPPIVPRAPIAEFACAGYFPGAHYYDDFTEVWALYEDGEFGPWLGGTEPSQTVSLAPIPIAISEYGHRLMLVGTGGSVSVLDPRLKSPHMSCTGVVDGRPLIVDGLVCCAPAAARDDWADRLAPRLCDLDADTRRRLAADWARDAAFEHASVASFARWILELLACGAPSELIVAAQGALADELRHARLCYGLASAYAGQATGPGPLPAAVAEPVCSDLSQLAAATVRDGCINETIAAVQAAVAAALCSDPEVRRVLASIAADEARHAALAWRAVAWALRTGGAPVRDAVARAFARAHACLPVAVPDDECDDHSAFGRLPAASLHASARATLRELIAPAAARLLGQGDNCTPQSGHPDARSARPGDGQSNSPFGAHPFE